VHNSCAVFHKKKNFQEHTQKKIRCKKEFSWKDKQQHKKRVFFKCICVWLTLSKNKENSSSHKTERKYINPFGHLHRRRGNIRKGESQLKKGTKNLR